MAKGDSPDYIVKLPVNSVWHRLGAAWKSKKDDKDSITLVLDVDAAGELPDSVLGTWVQLSRSSSC